MDSLIIRGGRPLEGEIAISGAKNAALPLMCAGILTDQPLKLTNIPHLADIGTLSGVLEHLGVLAKLLSEPSDTGGGDTLVLDAAGLDETTAPYDMVRKMRASILVLGPLVARHGHARVSMPGGCAIGNRPIDLHLEGLRQLGAGIVLEDGYVEATAPPGGLKGATVRIPMVSVGATENILLAATLAKGTTVIENAAREPEIADLAACLRAMGAQISGIGSQRLEIIGQDSLSGARHRVMPDRIETGSYAVAAAITGGQVKLSGTDPGALAAVIRELRASGSEVIEGDDWLEVKGPDRPQADLVIRTAPYPGFPTDMQAQFMALLATANGTSVVTETIFENRFMHVPELARMGAEIAVTASTATIHGVERLRGAAVMATDLRASMGLALAALAAEGETVLSRVYHLDRGYERLEKKLAGVGADIRRASAQEGKG
ncbi:MAG: UDP-N-acetylglucosamine 1-carboxyvinyltransferase [Sphingomonadales bacterium]